MAARVGRPLEKTLAAERERERRLTEPLLPGAGHTIYDGMHLPEQETCSTRLRQRRPQMRSASGPARHGAPAACISARRRAAIWHSGRPPSCRDWEGGGSTFPGRVALASLVRPDPSAA